MLNIFEEECFFVLILPKDSKTTSPIVIKLSIMESIPKVFNSKIFRNGVTAFRKL